MEHLTDIQDYHLNQDISGTFALDIGAGEGHVSAILSGFYDAVLGIDHSLDGAYRHNCAHCKNCIPIKAPIAYVIKDLYDKSMDLAYIDLGDVPDQMLRYALNMIYPKTKRVLIKRNNNVDATVPTITDLWSNVIRYETFYVLE